VHWSPGIAASSEILLPRQDGSAEPASQNIHENNAARVAGPSRICFAILCGADIPVRDPPPTIIQTKVSLHVTSSAYDSNPAELTVRAFSMASAREVCRQRSGGGLHN